MLPYFGEMLALSTAVTWALAVIFFKKSGESVHPLALNFFKAILCFLLLFFTLLPLGQVDCPQASWRDYCILLGSGIVGIGISDTFFFKSLNLLGAGLSAIVDCLYSPLVIFFSFCFLDERMKIGQLVGVAFILSAVLAATSRRGRAHLSRKDLIFGIFYGIFAMVTVSSSIVMVKPLLTTMPVLWVSYIRQLGGILVLFLILVLHQNRRPILASLQGNWNHWQYTILGCILGSYISVFLWIAAMKYTFAGVAAALSQTSNIFIFILAALFLREPLNLQRCVGIILAVTGVFLIMFI